MDNLRAARKLLVRCVAQQEFSAEDHRAYMCLTFGSRQVEHSLSLESLFPSRDCLLVARSMIEGDSMLLWAIASDDRARRWRDFMHIENWRLLRKKKKAGVPLTREETERIERELEEVGANFLTSAAERAVAEGESIPEDPYVRRWHDRAGYSMKAECEAHDVLGLYDTIYKKMSDWHHWGSLSVGQALRASEGAVGYTASDGTDAEGAVKVGVMAILHTAAIVDHHLRLGTADEIRAFVDRFHATDTTNTIS